MPLIDLTYPAGALTEKQRAEAVDGLTSAVLQAERAPDTDFMRDITWVHVHELPQHAVLAGGRPVDAPIFRVDVTTPEGALSDRRRKELVASATTVVRRAADLGAEDLARVWVLLHEVPEGSWGAAGHVVEFAQLRVAAAREREKAGHPEQATA